MLFNLVVVTFFAFVSCKESSYSGPETYPPSPFVLSTHEIHGSQLPDIKYSFNPSILKIPSGTVLFVFRLDKFYSKTENELGYILLDDKSWAALQAPKKTLWDNGGDEVKQLVDGRLFVFDDKIYIAYCCQSLDFSVFYMVELVLNEKNELRALMGTRKDMIYPEANQEVEKNWGPFQFDHKTRGGKNIPVLFVEYSIVPHRILHHNRDPSDLQNNPLSRLPLSSGMDPFHPKYAEMHSSYCTTIEGDDALKFWADWGTLHGGTPPRKVWTPDLKWRYLSFFHTRKKFVGSDGVKRTYYAMGAYLFKPLPPFVISHISKYPIVGDTFYSGNTSYIYGHSFDIFPGSFYKDGQSIFLSYGRNDRETWVMRMNTVGLYASLAPVQSRHCYPFNSTRAHTRR